MWKVAVDLMGGDQPPEAIFEAVLQLVKEAPSGLHLIAIAHEKELPALKNQLLSFFETEEENQFPFLEWVLAQEIVEMHDSPLTAARRKKDSSMAMGLKLVKEKKAHAFVSTGNTGALLATAMMHLPLLPTIDRPALLVVLPTGPKGMVVLDVGANVSVKPEHLLNFARLGTLFRQCVQGVKNPTCGLLNIGVEAGKGTAILKEAYLLMQKAFENTPVRFLGNVEPKEAFQQGGLDVLVTDGFAGNVFLKTCEGVTSFFIDYLRGKLAPEKDGRLLAALHQEFDYSAHPGAILAGLDGIVIKCHGASDASAVLNGIRGAFKLAKSDFIEKMRSGLTN